MFLTVCVCVHFSVCVYLSMCIVHVCAVYVCALLVIEPRVFNLCANRQTEYCHPQVPSIMASLSGFLFC